MGFLTGGGGGGGILLGFEIILIAILLTYLLSAEPAFLELMIEAIGFFLFLAIGTSYCSHVSNLEAESQRAWLGALGGMCVIIAAVFLIDFIVSIVYRKR